MGWKWPVAMMRPSRETCKSSGSCTGRHTQTEKRCTSATTRYSETWQIRRSCQNILQEVWKRASSTWNLNNTRLSIFQLRMGEWKWEKDNCTFSKWFVFNDEIQHQTSAAIRYNAKHATCNFFFQHLHPHEPYASLTLSPPSIQAIRRLLRRDKYALCQFVSPQEAHEGESCDCLTR